MRQFLRFYIFLVSLCCTLLFSCKNKTGDNSINLSYTINYTKDTITNKLVGLKWTLSFLGAELRDSSFEKNAIVKEKQIIQLNYDKIGFNKEAIAALNQLCDSLKNTEEYLQKNSIDIGEFTSLTIGTSKHYYAITGVSKTLADFKLTHNFKKEVLFPVTQSSVSFHDRMIRMNTDSLISNIAFIAEEGTGEIEKGNFVSKTFEVFDVMPNGQLRFAIYDENGHLVDASPSNYGEAGKPAKCLWCHEIVIQPLFKSSPAIKNYIDENKFHELILKQMTIINNYRTTLTSSIDFSKTQEHTYMELLYISYTEPSLQKLSQEWNIPLDKLKQLTKNNQFHKYTEFPFLGELLYRSDVKTFSPYKTNETPLSIREPIGTEPYYLKTTK